jgi:hypothetical protein
LCGGGTGSSSTAGGGVPIEMSTLAAYAGLVTEAPIEMATSVTVNACLSFICPSHIAIRASDAPTILNRLHSTVVGLDRLSSNELSMTQELIANMLGVRREGVTGAPGKLQDAGLIQYHRGTITVVDRPGLEARVCECYQVVKTEFDRLLPYV